ncbi:MAG: class I SAM-dependent methyltransferase [Vicinamibacteria bacterium]
MTSPGAGAVTSRNLEAYESERGTALYGAESGLTPLERALVDEFFPRPPARVLDIGCGAGRTTIGLEERGYQVVGIDLSPNLLALARRRFGALRFHRGDAASLPYRSSSFDAALFSYNGIDCIYPVQSRIRCMQEVFRVLRPGGPFLLSSHNSIGAVFSGGFFYARGYWNALRNVAAQRGNPHLTTWYLWYPEEEQYLYSAPPDRTRRQLESAGFEFRAARGFRNETRLRAIFWRHQHVHFVAVKRG